MSAEGLAALSDEEREAFEATASAQRRAAAAQRARELELVAQAQTSKPLRIILQREIIAAWREAENEEQLAAAERHLVQLSDISSPM